MSAVGKYLLFQADTGTMIVHLGMSGRLRVIPAGVEPGPHDRFDLLTTGGHCLRFTDPRCFGSVLWTEAAVFDHPLLARLGPEPLEPHFNGNYLYTASRRRRTPVKNLIMDGRIVVGIGNIYANESLHSSGIHPGRASGRISRHRYDRLADSVRQVLTQAIEAGGTTLRDYVTANGAPGYFQTCLQVYARADQPCPQCRRLIRKTVLGGPHLPLSGVPKMRLPKRWLLGPLWLEPAQHGHPLTVKGVDRHCLEHPVP